MELRDIIIYFAIKYKGNWNLIYKAILSKEKPKEEEVKNAVCKLDCSVITIVDENYPIFFKRISTPPFAIFYFGNINLINNNIISVVGSRNVSQYGSEMTKYVVNKFIKYDQVVCSGLALGVDSIALEEALNKGLDTIAILPCGIDTYYPKQNFILYKKIKEKGLIISEYPNNTTVEPHNYHMRNRLIVALCEKLVITEAKNKSGTSISAHYALEYGKDIYCIPYPLDKNSYCNDLIRDGAFIITKDSGIY